MQIVSNKKEKPNSLFSHYRQLPSRRAEQMRSDGSDSMLRMSPRIWVTHRSKEGKGSLVVSAVGVSGLPPGGMPSSVGLVSLLFMSENNVRVAVSIDWNVWYQVWWDAGMGFLRRV